jgi:hypothetical protein
MSARLASSDASRRGEPASCARAIALGQAARAVEIALVCHARLGRARLHEQPWSGWRALRPAAAAARSRLSLRALQRRELRADRQRQLSPAQAATSRADCAIAVALTCTPQLAIRHLQRLPGTGRRNRLRRGRGSRRCGAVGQAGAGTAQGVTPLRQRAAMSSPQSAQPRPARACGGVSL